MMSLMKPFLGVTLSILILLGIHIPIVSAEQESNGNGIIEYYYDNFNDGVINGDLWWIINSANEETGKLILDAPSGTDVGISALRQPFIGMWCSMRGYQHMEVGDHLGIHMATATSGGGYLTVGIYRHLWPPANPNDPLGENNYVFCGTHQVQEHIDLEPAQWGADYTFGLEYTPQGAILVWVNGQVAHSFSVPGSILLILKAVPIFGLCLVLSKVRVMLLLKSIGQG